MGTSAGMHSSDIDRRWLRFTPWKCGPRSMPRLSCRSWNTLPQAPAPAQTPSEASSREAPATSCSNFAAGRRGAARVLPLLPVRPWIFFAHDGIDTLMVYAAAGMVASNVPKCSFMGGRSCRLEQSIFTFSIFEILRIIFIGPAMMFEPVSMMAVHFPSWQNLRLPGFKAWSLSNRWSSAISLPCACIQSMPLLRDVWPSSGEAAENRLDVPFQRAPPVSVPSANTAPSPAYLARTYSARVSRWDRRARMPSWSRTGILLPCFNTSLNLFGWWIWCFALTLLV
mmetsp:Transcript_62192/g.167721  ORF Transcript_62192/g.167721 Transcript_62192/m.167721 type:complete len:283 (+) Transcript_62192:110-958(+)